MIGRLASLKTTYQKGTISNTLLYTATQLVTLSVSASNQVEDELTHSVSISRSPEQVDYFVDADNADDYKFTGTLNENLARIGLMVAPLCMKYLVDNIYKNILEPYKELS